MNSWMEGALALIVVVGVGIGLFLFTGESLGDASDAEPFTLTVDPVAAERGQTLAEGQGCLQCHSVDGAPGTAPTWKGLAGSTRPLTDGTEVLADDAYLFASIVSPDTQVVEGYDPLMPAFYADQLDETQINDLVEYIKSLAG